MNFTPAPLLLVATLVAAAIVGVVTPANASNAPVSDNAYLSTARCAGIAQGLGRDAKPLKALMETEGRSREAFVYDRAEQVRQDAVMEAKRAGDDGRRHLTAEVDGACAAMLATSGSVSGR